MLAIIRFSMMNFRQPVVSSVDTQIVKNAVNPTGVVLTLTGFLLTFSVFILQLLGIFSELDREFFRKSGEWELWSGDPVPPIFSALVIPAFIVALVFTIMLIFGSRNQSVAVKFFSVYAILTILFLLFSNKLVFSVSIPLVSYTMLSVVLQNIFLLSSVVGSVLVVFKPVDNSSLNPKILFSLPFVILGFTALVGRVALNFIG